MTFHMFINIGNGNVIQSRDIIAILDYELINSSVIMEKMNQQAKTSNKLKGLTIDAKSIMVTTDWIYYSSLSVATLRKRASIQSTIRNLDDYSDEITT